jgi:hypothetical protein
MAHITGGGLPKTPKPQHEKNWQAIFYENQKI